MSPDNNSSAIVPTVMLRNISHFNHSEQLYKIITENATKEVTKDPLITLTVPALMFASGVVGNLFAIFVLFRSSRDHKQTVFYRLVGALACTDLFGTCATSPVTLAVYANNLKWVGGKHLCNYESFIFVFVSYTTILIIGTMAIDRVLAIMCPFFYDIHVTYNRAKYCIFGLWGFAALMGCLPLTGLGEVVNQFPGTWCFFDFTSSKLRNQIFAYGYASLGLFVICLTGIANIIVTAMLLKMRRKAARCMNMGRTKRHDSELQMMVLLLGIIIVFATCWCPFLIRILINQASLRQVDVRADLLALRLASLNQILDPWVYILFRRELFKKTFAFLKENIFNRCKCCGLMSTNRLSSAYRVNNGQVIEVDDVNSNCHGYDGDYVPIEHENKGEVDDKHDRNEVKPLNMSSDTSQNSSPQKSENVALIDSSEKDHGHCHLHLKHSACLFCLSNHPKKIVSSSYFRGKSLEMLTIPTEKMAKEHFIVSVKGMGNDSLKCQSKRDSIHLSLDDIRWEQ